MKEALKNLLKHWPKVSPTIPSTTRSELFYQRLYRKNRVARTIVTMAGYGIIISIVAMFLFLLYQALPLASGASVKELFRFGIPEGHSRTLLTGMDPYREVYYRLDERGHIAFRRIVDQKVLLQDTLALAPGEKFLCASKGNLQEEIFAAGTSQGRIFTLRVDMKPVFHGNKRVVVPSIESLQTFVAEPPSDSLPAHIEKLAFSADEEGNFVWVWENHQAQVHGQFYDADDDSLLRLTIPSPWGNAQVSALALSNSGEDLALGFLSGDLYTFQFTNPEMPVLTDHVRASAGPISALSYLLGDQALVVGNTEGNVTVWFTVKSPLNIEKITLVHRFQSHRAAVTQVYPSSRNRLFLTVDARGGAHLNYSTTSQTQLVFQPSDYPLQAADIAPKSDAILVVDARGRVGIFQLTDPHPETTAKTLFGNVWYEGYPGPAFVWQSTGGSDAFEPKFSLIPLIFGTLKGTLYAMLFSVPIAILAAIYVSQFAPFWLARWVKPIVEIMAALPSVIIGFLAGLYFAPLFDKHLMTVFLTFSLLPLVFGLGIFLWRLIPEKHRTRVSSGWELWIVVPIFLFTLIFSVALSHPLEVAFFGGDIHQWLTTSLGMVYDTRNSIVVGFALGFAVIPITFTVAEDSLSHVPHSLTSAALALGASRWQTVQRVVLPAASPGIFAAIMLGFGRAIGETMIVLMATGNTPILDLSPFNGFRAMSACIAVEIPEAPVGGTLYRVLFLTGLLLFAFTFVINSLSALIGDLLRKKYARF